MSKANSRIKFNPKEGERIGMLTLVRQEQGLSKKGIYWRVICDCGNEKVMAKSAIARPVKVTKSCGCRCKISNLKHGFSRKSDLTYNSWIGMKNRCLNTNFPSYKDYGGRGITIYEPWLQFENFLKDMGQRPSKNHSLGRKDNNKGYSPDNCAWETAQEQANNTRSNNFLEVDGRRDTITQFARRFGISVQAIHARLRKGWSHSDAVKTPLKQPKFRGNMKRMLVVAGNIREFQEFYKVNKDKYDEILFVRDVESLRGMRNVFVTFYGTFYKRRDISKIEEEVSWRLKIGDLRAL